MQWSPTARGDSESTGKSDRKRHEKIARWTRALKVMAKTFDVPVIVLSQLNREPARGGKPTLADLRESGAIEQGADVVLLLHRGEEQTADLSMLIEKNRPGLHGNITLAWEGTFAFVSDQQQSRQHDPAHHHRHARSCHRPCRDHPRTTRGVVGDTETAQRGTQSLM